MAVYGYSIGYGASIKYKKLAKLLGIKIPKKVITEDGDSDSGSDLITSVRYRLEPKIHQYVKKEEIVMSKNGHCLEVMEYPHDSNEYKKKLLSIGIYIHISDCKDTYLEDNLGIMLKNKIKTKKFKKLFKKEPEFQVIMCGCRCCPEYN